MSLVRMSEDNVLPTEPFKTKSRDPFDPFKGTEAHWLVNGVYDELAAQLRIEKANAKMVADANYMNNARRSENEKRMEQRELAREIAEYH